MNVYQRLTMLSRKAFFNIFKTKKFDNNQSWLISLFRAKHKKSIECKTKRNLIFLGDPYRLLSKARQSSCIVCNYRCSIISEPSQIFVISCHTTYRLVSISSSKMKNHFFPSMILHYITVSRSTS